MSLKRQDARSFCGCGNLVRGDKGRDGFGVVIDFVLLVAHMGQMSVRVCVCVCVCVCLYIEGNTCGQVGLAVKLYFPRVPSADVSLCNTHQLHTLIPLAPLIN